MDFEFTEEQGLLRDSVDRLLADHYGFAQRRGYLGEPEGWRTALRLVVSDAQKSAILPQVAEGRLTLAFAHGERQARYDLADVMTTAKPTARGWVLDGAKSVVAHGDGADRLVVS